MLSIFEQNKNQYFPDLRIQCTKLLQGSTRVIDASRQHKLSSKKTATEEHRGRYRPGFCLILYQVHPQHFLVDFSGTFWLFFCYFMLLCTVTTSTRTSIFLICLYYKNYCSTKISTEKDPPVAGRRLKIFITSIIYKSEKFYGTS